MTAITADKNLIAHDFASTYHGRMPQDQIDDAVRTLLTTQASYPISNGSIIGGVFYTRITCDITVNGKNYAFVGNGGGLFTPGGGALLGDVYTDDAARLVASTVSFQVNATPVYVNVNFFDGSSNLLGNLQVGAVSTVVGTGGGSGSWS
jgi:Rhodococcus equi virulence-associated protein